VLTRNSRPHGLSDYFLLHERLMKQSPLPKEFCDGGWRALYIAALFENDRVKVAEKIAMAQHAVAARRRQLFVSGNDAQERQVLDNALFSLHALATSLAITPRLAADARAA
jgi:hypothetical protein